MLAASCSFTAAADRFAHTFDSPDTFARALLLALEAHDEAVLLALPLSEVEFREEVYPEMPASAYIPYGVPWRDLQEKGARELAGILRWHGGRGYDLESVRFDGSSAAYETFVVHKRPRLVVRDRATGERKTLALCGSLLEHRGRFKLFSWVVSR